MLQHQEIDRPLLPALARAARGWTGMAELEARTDAAVAQLRVQRPRAARHSAALARWQVALDDRLRTDQPEYLDDPGFPAERRVAIAHALHRFNHRVFAYARFYHALRPTLRRLSAELNRPVRVLEMASGSGEFALDLSDRARRDGLPVEVTGSDYFAEHVAACRAKATQRGVATGFREINAFDMGGLDEGAYDLVFIAQSLHHFSPGQIAMMIAQSMRVATTGFIGIDGQRSLGLYAVVPAMGALMGAPDFIHDAVISLRKFLTHSELELIARIAAPEAFVRARGLNPGYSMLEVLR